MLQGFNYSGNPESFLQRGPAVSTGEDLRGEDFMDRTPARSYGDSLKGEDFVKTLEDRSPQGQPFAGDVEAQKAFGVGDPQSGKEMNTAFWKILFDIMAKGMQNRRPTDEPMELGSDTMISETPAPLPGLGGR